MIELTEVERRVRDTLHGKADQIDGPAPGFSPETVRVIELADARRPARRAVYAAAAVAIAVAIGGAFLFATADDRGRGVNRADLRTPTSSPATSGSGEGALAPNFIPAGLELWNMTTHIAFPATQSIFTTQLFGTVDSTGAPSPGLLLRIQSGGTGGGTTFGDPVTVRGVAGSSAAPKEGVETSETITWSEGGASISATVRGLTRSDAVVALNALRLRTTDPRDGYDAGSLPLLGETLSKAERTPSVESEFDYAPVPLVTGGSPSLRVVSATDADYPGYLGFWIEGRREADGSVVKRDPGWGLDVAWPGRQQVLVYSTTDDWPTLERVARSAKPARASDLTELRSGIDERLGALPLVAAATVNGSAVELRGAGAPTTLCFVLSDGQRCGPPAGFGQATTEVMGASVIVDGVWRLAVASRVPVQIHPGVDFTGPDLARHAAANGWDFAVADIANNLSQVQVLAGPDSNQGTGVPRPDR